MIRDIVKRVKCEISDAFDSKVDDPRFYWMRNWTAKVDLTLQVNEQAGLAPSVAYTKFFHNAFNFAAGSSSLTANNISSVSQFFTLSANANLSEQAQRSEVVSFSLSLKELKTWRKRLRREAAASGASVEEVECAAGGAELRGKLGLREWIDAALYPVEASELQSGQHPNPVTGASKPPSGGGGSSVSKAEPIPIGDARRRVNEAATSAKASLARAQASEQSIPASVETARGYMQTTAPFFPTLTDELKRAIPSYVSTINTAAEYAKQDVQNATAAVAKIDEISAQLAAAEQRKEVFFERVEEAERAAADAKSFAEDVDKQRKLANSLAASLPKIDPPIDGLLHSVQFVLAYGASISPNWTLLQWKGPALTAPGFSASGVRTHVLNIALGPPAEQARLIQNQTVNNAAHP